MGVTTLHGLAPVQIDTTAIGGITALDTGFDTEFTEEPSSGELTARIQAIHAQKFRPTFSTMDLYTVLTACGSLGVALATKNLNMYARKYSAGGGRDTTGHLKYTYQHGLLLPVSIDCNHQGDASLSMQAVVTYDGENDPLVIAASASLPSITSDPRWTLGAVVLGGVSIPQIKNVRADFGIRADSEGSDSDVWDTHPSVSAVQPKFTVTSSRIAALIDVIGASGSANLVFRQRADGGTFGPATLTLSGSGLATFSKPFSASGNGPGELSIEARLKYDGVNDPIIVVYDAGT